MITKKLWQTIAAMGALVPCGGLHADPQNAGASSRSGGVLEEIVVTAQRRTENIQDVPIAVTALSGDELAAKGIDSTLELQVAVPGLVYTQQYGAGVAFLRGIGSDITIPNADNPVATYVDGVYISSPWGSLINLMGVERVEVLAGPQGTLYGRNATGGAINIYTLTPSQDLEVAGSASSGKHDAMEGSARISGPITDELSAGLYLAGTLRDSYLDRSDGSRHREPDDETTEGVRAKVVWTPSDAATLTASADIARITSFEYLALQNKSENALGAHFGGQVDTRKYKVMADWPDYGRVEQKGAMLKGEFDTSLGRFVSLSGARRTENDQSNEIDATTAPVAESSAVYLTEQWSQEFQLLSHEDSPIEWILGAYYYNEEGGRDPQRSYAFQPGVGIYQSAAQEVFVETDSYAAYAQATAPLGFISDDLRLTLGGRYINDKKRKHGAERTPLLPDGSPSGPTVVLDEIDDDWSQFTPKVSLDYKLENTLLYASYSKGFKSGAFNIITFSNDDAVDPETVNAYEVGTKSDFLEQRLRLNTSLYYYKHEDLQVQTVQNTPTGGVQVLLTNATSGEFYGAEVALTWVATQDLTLHLTGTTQHAEFGKFLGYPGNLPAAFPPFVPVTLDVSDNRPARTPEYTASGAIDYRHEMGSSGSIFANVSAYYNDGFYWNAQNDFEQSSYTLVNASLGYSTPDEHWTFSLWGTNLTDKYYRYSNIVTGVGVLAQDAPPRFYGVRVAYSL